MDGIFGLVVVNSLMVMVGGIVVVLVVGCNDLGFIYNGLLVGLVVVCVGLDLMYLIGFLIVGGVVGGLFVFVFIIV